MKYFWISSNLLIDKQIIFENQWIIKLYGIKQFIYSNAWMLLR